MRKTSEKGDAMREDIVQAALALFLEKGYEGTSIRMIQSKVGREVGLFYYYFASKEAVLEAAIERFFASYEQTMQCIVRREEEPEKILTEYIDYIAQTACEFRQRYRLQLHWSMLSAIREYMLKIMRRDISEILQRYLREGIVSQPQLGLETTADLLAFGVGGSILYQENDSYTAQRDHLYQVIPLLLKGRQ